MDFQDFVCDILRAVGDVQSKKMFGTYNICLDCVNLGLLCENKWYLKKTAAGDAYIETNGISLETGIKGNSYIVIDFSDEKTICELAKITRDALLKK